MHEMRKISAWDISQLVLRWLRETMLRPYVHWEIDDLHEEMPDGVRHIWEHIRGKLPQLYFEVQAILADRIRIQYVDPISFAVAQRVLYYLCDNEDIDFERSPPLPWFNVDCLFKLPCPYVVIAHVSELSEIQNHLLDASRHFLRSHHSPHEARQIASPTDPKWEQLLIAPSIFSPGLSNLHVYITIEHALSLIADLPSPEQQEPQYFIRPGRFGVILSVSQRMKHLLCGPLKIYYLTKTRRNKIGQFWYEMTMLPRNSDNVRFLYWFIMYLFGPDVTLRCIDINANLERFLNLFPSICSLWKTMLMPLVCDTVTSMRSTRGNVITLGNGKQPNIYTALASLLIAHHYYYIPGEYVQVPDKRPTFIINKRRGWIKLTAEEARILYETATDLNILMWMVADTLVEFKRKKGTHGIGEGFITDFEGSFKPMTPPEVHVAAVSFLQHPTFSAPRPQLHLTFFLQALEHLFTFGLKARCYKTNKLVEVTIDVPPPLFCRGVLIEAFSIDTITNNGHLFSPWTTTSIKKKCKFAPLNSMQMVLLTGALKPEDKRPTAYARPPDDPEFLHLTIPVWSPIADIQSLDLLSTCYDRHPFCVLPAGPSCTKCPEEGDCQCQLCTKIRAHQGGQWLTDVRAIPQIPADTLTDYNRQLFLYVDGRLHWYPITGPPCVHCVPPKEFPHDFIRAIFAEHNLH
jgi:hypothetical protein